jgi:hypothetical protein
MFSAPNVWLLKPPRPCTPVPAKHSSKRNISRELHRRFADPTGDFSTNICVHGSSVSSCQICINQLCRRGTMRAAQRGLL